MTGRDAYNRIRWDARFREEAFVIGYVDRTAPGGTAEKPFMHWEGDIPWHRMVYIRCDAFYFWHRDPRRQSKGDPPVSNAGLAPRRFPGPELAPLSNGSLRLASFNVLDRPDDAERHRGVADVILAMQADVVALQEVTPPLLQRLEQTLPGWYATEGDLNPHGVVLLCRSPFTYTVRTYTSHKRGLAAQIGSLRVATIHLPSDMADGAEILRRQYLADLLTWIGDGDCIVAGDFNLRGNELDDVVASHG